MCLLAVLSHTGPGVPLMVAANRDELEALDEHERWDRLCELNVIRQVQNVASDVFVQDAWARGQSLSVHGWVYRLSNGLVNDLNVTVTNPAEYEELAGFAPEI